MSARSHRRTELQKLSSLLSLVPKTRGAMKSFIPLSPYLPERINRHSLSNFQNFILEITQRWNASVIQATTLDMRP